MKHTCTTTRAFMECPRKYYYMQICGYFPKYRPEYVNLGILFHRAMEAYAHGGLVKAQRQIKNDISNTFDEARKIEDMDTKLLEKAEYTLLGMVEGYPYEVNPTSAEMKFEVEFEGHLLGGKVDGIRTGGGRAMIFDYKTKGSLDGVDDHALLSRDFQASFYFYGLGLLCKRFEGVEFIYVRRPSLRQRRKERFTTFCERIYKDYLDENRRDFYYGRAFTFRDPDDKTWLENLKNVLKNIQIFDNFDIWPMHETACRLYRRCQYLPICNNEEGWQEKYDVLGPDAHPELEDD